MRQPPALAPDHHEQPGRDGRERADGADAPVKQPKRLLHGVVHVGGDGTVPLRIPADVGLRESEQRAEGVLVATLRRLKYAKIVAGRHQAFEASCLPPM